MKKQKDIGSVTTAEGFSNHLAKSWDEVVLESYPHIDFDQTEAQFEPEDLSVRQEVRKSFILVSPSSGAYQIIQHSEEKYGAPKPMRPKYSPYVLRDMAENDPDVSAALDCYAVNIGGSGWTLNATIPIEEKYNSDGQTVRLRTDTREEVPQKLWATMQAEKAEIETFIENLSPRLTFRQLRMQMVRSMEEIGNAFWEAIRGLSGDNALLGFNKIKDESTIRLCEEDLEPVEDFKRLIRKGQTIVEVPMDWLFRRFVQVGKKGKRYYKSFGDVRFLDRDTGIYYEDGQQPSDAKPASELVHFKMPSGIDYGRPRYTANAFGIQTNKSAQLTNRETMNNSGIPKLALILRNCKDKGLEQSIKKNFKDIKESGSKEMIMVIRTPPEEIGVGPDAKQVDNEIRFERLADQQEKDGMYLKLQEHNTKKTQTTMRLPDLLMGRSDSNLNRATAFIMQANVEKQVFQPARQDFDDWMNREIFPMMGFKYWTFVSQSMDLNDTELYIRLIELYASYGGLLPNDLRALADELIDVPLAPLEEEWASIPKHIAILQQKVMDQNAQAVNGDKKPKDDQADEDEDDPETKKQLIFFAKAVIKELMQEMPHDGLGFLYRPAKCG